MAVPHPTTSSSGGGLIRSKMRREWMVMCGMEGTDQESHRSPVQMMEPSTWTSETMNPVASYLHCIGVVCKCVFTLYFFQCTSTCPSILAIPVSGGRRSYCSAMDSSSSCRRNEAGDKDERWRVWGGRGNGDGDGVDENGARREKTRRHVYVEFIFDDARWRTKAPYFVDMMKQGLCDFSDGVCRL